MLNTIPRKRYIKEKLKAIYITKDDKIRVIRKTDINEGILMPHHQFSDDVINIKLKMELL